MRNTAELIEEIEINYKKICNLLVVNDGVLCKIKNKDDNPLVIVVPETLRIEIMEQ
jgi:hypothetical protein